MQHTHDKYSKAQAQPPSMRRPSSSSSRSSPDSMDTQTRPSPIGPQRTAASTMFFAAGAVAYLLLLLWQAASAQACTTIVVGREATTDGSLLVTHNNDCEDCDPRLGMVPATDNEPGSRCPIHPCGFDFPRYVGNDRGPLYTQQQLALEGLEGYAPNVTRPLGSIPQAAHTYRYLDGTYGMMNTAQLSIGESTCGAKLVAYSLAQGGDALFDVSALTRLAMQRCTTARCAIRLMGDLAVAHGYAGSEDPLETGHALFEVAGEALTIIDTREAWVMHMLADATGRSAIWAAQRVPHDHAAVVPNQFVIDRINVSDKENFMASPRIAQAAIDAGFLAANVSEAEGGDDNFHFSAAFSLDYVPGENDGKGELRRWRVFSVLAPSMGFQPDQHTRFPFSVKVEKKVDARDIMALMRDHFEGTPYDQTRGLAAGPYGNPNRYDRNTEVQPEVSKGYFDRTISIHRTSYSFVAQTRAPEGSGDTGSSATADGAEADEPFAAATAAVTGKSTRSVDYPNGLGGVLWLAHHTPQTSLYLPLFGATLALPESFGRGSLYRLDRASAWWAFAAVSNNADRMYGPIHAYIAERQELIEKDSVQRVQRVSKEAAQLFDRGQQEEALQLISNFTVAHNQALVDRWWQLLDELTVTFRDGMRMKEHIFYPLEWLRQVGYFDRGALPMPPFPPVPKPAHAVPVFPAATQASAEGHTLADLIQTSGTREGLINGASVRAPSIPAPTPVAAMTSLVDRSPSVAPAQSLVDRDEDEGDDGGAAAGGYDQRSVRTGKEGSDRDVGGESDGGGNEGGDKENSNHGGGGGGVWDWLSSKKVRTPLGVALFTLLVVLVAVVCFQLGKLCAPRRDDYQPIGDELPYAARGYGAREGFSRTGPRAVLSTR